MSVQFTKADLEALPGYPQVAHVPIERLVLTDGPQPLQRLDQRGQPVCWTGDHAVTGTALFCDACKSIRVSRNQARRRNESRADVPVSKESLGKVHDAVDALAPLIDHLTVAYNYGGNLRDEVNAIMLAVKKVEREVRVLLPDPRPSLPGHDGAEEPS